MLFRWLTRRRRRRILSRPFPEEWQEILRLNVRHWQQLQPQQQARLRQLIQVFVAEKNWEGCRGLVMTDEIRVTIAAQACLLVVAQDDIYFDHVLSILVYPDAYVAPEVEITRGGVVIEGGEPRLGEAWWRGPVILSWQDVLAGGRGEIPGRNLTIHEFAHQLDMLNGRVVDGTPPLADAGQVRRWIDVMEPAWRDLTDACGRGHRGFIDCYGATNVAEFFAVLSEVFFEEPHQLLRHHEDVYSVLRDYSGLDPATWPER